MGTVVVAAMKRAELQKNDYDDDDGDDDDNHDSDDSEDNNDSHHETCACKRIHD